jgi:hypothetical protein
MEGCVPPRPLARVEPGPPPNRYHRAGVEPGPPKAWRGGRIRPKPPVPPKGGTASTPFRTLAGAQGPARRRAEWPALAISLNKSDSGGNTGRQERRPAVAVARLAAPKPLGRKMRRIASSGGPTHRVEGFGIGAE